MAACLDDQDLLDTILRLIDSTKTADQSNASLGLTVALSEIIIQGSKHSIKFWEAVQKHPQIPPLLRHLLLDDLHATVRSDVSMSIVRACEVMDSVSAVSSLDFVEFFWPILSDMIPETLAHPRTSKELLATVKVIFRKRADVSMTALELRTCFLQWSSLLSSSKAVEYIGRPDVIDVAIQGISGLLLWCVQYAKGRQLSLPSNGVAVVLFDNHLFPPLSDFEQDTPFEVNAPLLDTYARHNIAQTISLITKDDRQQYTSIVDRLYELVTYDHGHTTEESPYSYDLCFGFERNRNIRSSTGYVGLRNLSNTCYLNSLITQLYMNVSFREFMLNANVADGRASQLLLSETQKLFGWMQNSLGRYCNPAALAQSIRTYEETPIDVTIQMDVDEFYNLLFDRWEGQILAPEEKAKFRSFYGGQLVQQVKSKECSHISERLEPFSAIQCDIKGKRSLEESLQAYVDGEVMEGGMTQ
jgi:ubiquitin carboxyl-terminal hydrolase 34